MRPHQSTLTFGSSIDKAIKVAKTRKCKSHKKRLAVVVVRAEEIGGTCIEAIRDLDPPGHFMRSVGQENLWGVSVVTCPLETNRPALVVTVGGNYTLGISHHGVTLCYGLGYFMRKVSERLRQEVVDVINFILSGLRGGDVVLVAEEQRRAPISLSINLKQQVLLHLPRDTPEVQVLSVPFGVKPLPKTAMRLASKLHNLHPTGALYDMTDVYMDVHLPWTFFTDRPSWTA